MKKILFRKLLSDYLSFFFVALISTGIVIWVFQAVNFLDIMIEDGRDYLVYINFSLLNFPKIISKIFPFILFFSLFYVTNRYELSNELMIFQILFTSYIVPTTQDKARSFLKTSKVNFFGNFVKPQKFNDTIKGFTIYADKKDKDGNLFNIYLKKELDDQQFQITYAKKGEFKDLQNMPVLVLYDGATITSKNNNELTNISFSKSNYSLENFETNTTTYKKTQEISSINLIMCIKNFYKFEEEIFYSETRGIINCNVQNMNNILKEFYKRFIIPFYIPILSVISFFLIIISKENLKYQKVKLATFLIGLSIIIFSEATIRFISKDSFQNIILILIPIFLFIIFYLFLMMKIKYSKSAT